MRTHSDAVARQMRTLRRARGWTAAQLAARMTAAGVPWRREMVANLENGRRAHVSVDEWLMLGQVFGVSPLLLLPGAQGSDGLAKLTDVEDVARRALTGLGDVIHDALAAIDDVDELFDPALFGRDRT
jgi:transcriptional regulator with XRE-family HTH domain